MYTAQLLVSLWTVGTFIAVTYIRKVSGIMRQVRIAQGVWFFLHHMFTALRCEFNFGCFFTIENIVDFLTLPNMLKYLTVPIKGGTWISLDFFRSVTALGAATHLETLNLQRASHSKAKKRREKLFKKNLNQHALYKGAS